jgi:hypothetical protein
VPIEVTDYRLIEYDPLPGFKFIELTKDLGTHVLPYRVELGFVVEFTGTPTDHDRVTVEVLDTAKRRLCFNAFAVAKSFAHAGRADLRLDPVILSEAGVYTVRAWLGECLVFARRLTLAGASSP